jgi:hypothetical protein
LIQIYYLEQKHNSKLNFNILATITTKIEIEISQQRK